jgi:hypothetical protein
VKGGAQIGIESIVCRRFRNGDQQPRGTGLHEGAQCRSAPKQGEEDEARMMIAQKPALASGQNGRILRKAHGILSTRGHGGGGARENNGKGVVCPREPNLEGRKKFKAQHPLSKGTTADKCGDHGR